MTLDEFKADLVIAITTFNRKEMTELCIKNLVDTSQGAAIWIYDDHSAQYDLAWLRSIAPMANVVQKPKKLRVEKLRVEIHKDAAASSFKYIYHTDNDAIHDPQWLNELHRIYEAHKGWIGLYRSPFHFPPHRTEHGYSVGPTCPGISFFYPIKMLDGVDIDKPKALSWDFDFGNHLKSCAIADVSFVEHFGAGGIHNSSHDRDRAKNPTDWLKTKRPEILELLKEKI